MQVYSCAQCTHRFTMLPVENEEPYDAAYFETTHRNWFAHPDVPHFTFIAHTLRTLAPDTRSLIDVGCGRGDLLFFLEEQCPGLRLTGTDLIANVHPRITFREENVFTATFAEQYDAVTCLHTIEHVRDPQALVRIFDTLLKPGGILIVSTIDSSSFIHSVAAALKRVGFATPYNRIFSHHHLQHFTFHSLETVLQNGGFTIVQHRNYNHPLQSVDVPGSAPLIRTAYKAVVSCMFTGMRLCRRGMLQTIVCTKPQTKAESTPS